ncbi:MAG: hypothetical protein R2804_07105 [Cyclobacteriaceae bacterium]
MMKHYLYFLVFSSLNGFAQIQVHEEPLHHPVFEKSNTRILDVIAHPNDTSLMHQHSNNYCYVTIDGGKIWVQNEGEEGRTLELPLGFTGGYFNNPNHALVHRFANRSEGLIRLIAVENLSKGNSGTLPYQPSDEEETLIDNSHFLTSKAPIAGGKQEDFKFSTQAVIVNLSETPLYVEKKRKSSELNKWIWVKAQSTVSIHNPTSQPIWIVLVQVKKP